MRLWGLSGGIVWMCVWLLSHPALAGQRMTHIVLRTIVAEAASDSPVAEPRELWRVRQQSRRIDSPADPSQAPYGLVIARGAQTWLVDRTPHRPYRFREHGSPFPSAAIAPSVHGRRPRGLYFGNEVAFFRARAVQATGERDIAGVHAHPWTVPLGHGTPGLYRQESGRPLRFGLRGPDVADRIGYDVYGPDLEPRWALFVPPRGVRIIEGRYATAWTDEQGKGALDRLARQEQQD